MESRCLPGAPPKKNILSRTRAGRAPSKPPGRPSALPGTHRVGRRRAPRTYSVTEPEASASQVFAEAWPPAAGLNETTTVCQIPQFSRWSSQNGVTGKCYVLRVPPRSDG